MQKKMKKLVTMKTTMAAAVTAIVVTTKLALLVLATGEVAAREGREQPGLCRRRPVGRCLAVPVWGCRVAAAAAVADVASSASSSAAAAPGTGPSGARGWAAGPACWPARRSTTRLGRAAHTSGMAARCDTVHNKNESLSSPNRCNHPLNAFIQFVCCRLAWPEKEKRGEGVRFAGDVSRTAKVASSGHHLGCSPCCGVRLRRDMVVLRIHLSPSSTSPSFFDLVWFVEPPRPFSLVPGNALPLVSGTGLQEERDDGRRFHDLLASTTR
jgi:hypothetical protein